MAVPVSVNPYQSPSTDTSAEPDGALEPAGKSTLLIVLCLFVALHLIVALASTLIGLLFQLPVALFGGLVSAGFYIAIFIGLLKRQEWARVNLIWFCYVGIVVYLVQIPRAVWFIAPLVGLEFVTLLIAHSRTVRNLTRGHSLAKTYTYTESNS